MQCINGPRLLHPVLREPDLAAGLLPCQALLKCPSDAGRWSPCKAKLEQT